MSAGYENLTPAQQAEFDRLMTSKTNTWPPELIGYVRNRGGSFSGDALADAVGDWVKRNVR
jgi:hypothetical protein